MADIRFQRIEDGPLAEIWYALGGAAVRHPDHFKSLMDDYFETNVTLSPEARS
jgi:hypothetical protein